MVVMMLVVMVMVVMMMVFVGVFHTVVGMGVGVDALVIVMIVVVMHKSYLPFKDSICLYYTPKSVFCHPLRGDTPKKKRSRTAGTTVRDLNFICV